MSVCIYVYTYVFVSVCVCECGHFKYLLYYIFRPDALLGAFVSAMLDGIRPGLCQYNAITSH